MRLVRCACARVVQLLVGLLIKLVYGRHAFGEDLGLGLDLGRRGLRVHLELLDCHGGLRTEAFGHHPILPFNDFGLLLDRELLQFGLQLLDEDSLLLGLGLAFLFALWLRETGAAARAAGAPREAAPKPTRLTRPGGQNAR